MSRKGLKNLDYMIDGHHTAVPVIDGNLPKAIKLFNRKFLATGKVDELNERKQFEKPSSKRRKQMEFAKSRQKRLSKS
jgi:small subunit ribosomal protein S21